MNKRTKKILGALAISAGAIGTVGTLLMKRPGIGRRRKREQDQAASVWARPGMLVTFRAELKPGRDAAERTCRVVELLSNGRVILEDVGGEHTENEFERSR